METTETRDSGAANPEVDAESLIARAFQEDSQEPESTEETEQVAETEAEATDESTEPEPESEAQAEDEFVLSQEYIDSLNDDDKRQLAEWVGSGLGKDMGKLRSKVREWEEKYNSLEAKYKESINDLVPKSENPFSQITDERELTKKEGEIKKAIKYWQSVERKRDWQSNENGDEGYYEGNVFYPKEAIMNSVDAWVDQLPQIVEQRYKIRESRSIEPMADAEFAQAKKELPWLDDRESDRYKTYNRLVSDRDVEMIADLAPRLGAKLKRLLAHSANSLEKPNPSEIRLPKRGKPSSIGDTATGTAELDRGQESKALRAAKGKIASGEYTDKDVVSALIAPSFTK